MPIRVWMRNSKSGKPGEGGDEELWVLIRLWMASLLENVSYISQSLVKKRTGLEEKHEVAA